MINIKATGVKKALLTMDPRIVRKAGSRAINRVAKMARTEASKEIRKRYAIKKADVDPAIRLHGSTTRTLQAKIRVVGGKIPLIKFRISVLARRKGSPGGPPVKVRVLRAGGSTRMRHAFYGVMKSGHKGVYERDTRTRFPISELYGPSVPTMMEHPSTLAAIRKKVEANFDRLFTHNLNRLKAMKGGR